MEWGLPAPACQILARGFDVTRASLHSQMTEFGKTPLFSAQELAGVGVSMVLYPLSAFRAQSRGAELARMRTLQVAPSCQHERWPCRLTCCGANARSPGVQGHFGRWHE